MSKIKSNDDLAASGELVIFKTRGSKMRRRNTATGKIGRWEDNPDYRPKATVVTATAKIDTLSARTVKELRDLAKSNGLTGYSKMRKPELIDALTTV